MSPESTSCEPNLLSLIEDCDVGIRSSGRATRGDSWHGGGGEDRTHGPLGHGPRVLQLRLVIGNFGHAPS